MNKLIVLIALIIVSFESSIACTIEIPPLRKEFRRADSVFIGKILNVIEYNPSDVEIQKVIPKLWRTWNVFSKVTVEINKKWKGSSSNFKEFLSVSFFSCGCPDQKIDEFMIGEEYLIFSQRNGFLTICDSKMTKSKWTKTDIKQLDKFGFRFWARIYPF